MQAVGDVQAAAVRVGGDPAGGLTWGWRARAGLVQWQPSSQGRDGHLHALVVPEVALGAEFLVEDHRVVFALVPALLQVVSVGIQGGGLAGWAAHDFLPGAGAGILAHGSAVQAEVPGHGSVAPAGSGQGVDGLEQSFGVLLGSCVCRGVLGGLFIRCRIGHFSRRECCGQAASVGGSDVLDAT